MSRLLCTVDPLVAAHGTRPGVEHRRAHLTGADEVVRGMGEDIALDGADVGAGEAHLFQRRDAVVELRESRRTRPFAAEQPQFPTRRNYDGRGWRRADEKRF